MLDAQLLYPLGMPRTSTSDLRLPALVDPFATRACSSRGLNWSDSAMQ